MKSTFINKPLGRPRVHVDMKQLPRTLLKTFPSDGLKVAFDRAANTYALEATFENLVVCINLWEILEQQGCEEGDGSLTHLIDVIIRG